MSEDEELKAGLLDFLTDNIFGRERDAVNRAFYEYAEGDPHSHPVALAAILIACARQMAGLPKKTRDSVKELARAHPVVVMDRFGLHKRNDHEPAAV